MAWNDEHVAELRKLWPEPLTAAQIAREINKKFGTNYNKNSVIGKAKRLGLPPRQGEVQKGRLIVATGAPGNNSRTRCCWIINDLKQVKPRTKIRYCSKKMVGSENYCPDHLVIMFSKRASS